MVGTMVETLKQDPRLGDTRLYPRWIKWRILEWSFSRSTQSPRWSWRRRSGRRSLSRMSRGSTSQTLLRVTSRTQWSSRKTLLDIFRSMLTGHQNLNIKVHLILYINQTTFSPFWRCLLCKERPCPTSWRGKYRLQQISGLGRHPSQRAWCVLMQHSQLKCN